MLPPAHSNNDDFDSAVTLKGLRSGTRVFSGRYELTSELGRGGMGVVWLASDHHLDRQVALKFLPDDLARDDLALADLKKETRRCLDLTHPNIVRVHDWHEENGLVAISMEAIDGPSLSKLRLSKKDWVFTAGEVLPWLHSICDALTYAHGRARVVHRDLKPANIMVGKQGELKICDFGIARTLGESRSRLTGGRMSDTAGSPPYMSPQHMLGMPASALDDIYGLGATLYELFTGKPPFFQGIIERQIETVVPPTMADRRRELDVLDAEPIPPEWEAVVAACLEKDAARRPQSAAEVLARIANPAPEIPAPPPPSPPPATFRQVPPQSPPPASEPPRQRPPAADVSPPVGPGRRLARPLRVAAVALVVASLAGSGIWLATRDGNRSAVAQSPEAPLPLPEQLPIAWRAVDYATGKDDVQKALATFESAIGNADLDIDYQGRAGREAALALLETGDFLEGSLLTRVSENVDGDDWLENPNAGPWGYVNGEGRLVIPMDFLRAHAFKGGHAMVSSVSGEGWSGLIDANGKMVLDRVISSHGEGTACLAGSDKPGFLLIKGGDSINGKWTEVNAFNEGLARVQMEDGGMAFIDRGGNPVIKTGFTEAMDFYEGLAPAKKEASGLFGFMDRTGRWVIEPAWDNTWGFCEGLAPVEKSGKWGYIDRAGKLVIPLAATVPSLFVDGLAVTGQDGKFGFMDRTGKVVIPTVWEMAGIFHRGWAAVRKNGKYGFIDRSGRVLVEPEWDSLGVAESLWAETGMPAIEGLPVVWQKGDGEEGEGARMLVVGWDGLVVWSSDFRGVGRKPQRLPTMKDSDYQDIATVRELISARARATPSDAGLILFLEELADGKDIPERGNALEQLNALPERDRENRMAALLPRITDAMLAAKAEEAVSKASLVKQMADLRQASLGLTMYQADNNEYPLRLDKLKDGDYLEEDFLARVLEMATYRMPSTTAKDDFVVLYTKASVQGKRVIAKKDGSCEMIPEENLSEALNR